MLFRSAKKAPVAKKTVAAKAVKAVKTVKPVKSKAVKAVKSELYVQLNGQSYSEEQLTASAKDVWVYDMKQKEADFKKVALYVKPEEMRVYFVVNDEDAGSFNIY